MEIECWTDASVQRCVHLRKLEIDWFQNDKEI